MPHKVRKLLLDIRLSCQEISDFIEGKNFEDFKEDRILQLAIEREFEIIGEALSRLSRINEKKLGEKVPEYPKIIDFRNIIAHGYDIIDEAVVWDFAVNKVPELIVKIDRY